MQRLLMRPSLLALSLAAAAFVQPALGATPVIVQGTTDVRDAGLLDDVIVPGFQAAYPQYSLKFITVGSGQALANARAGQGDAVLTHAAAPEAQFVADGFSAEPFGRAVFYSDYVVIGPPSDPAGVLGGAPHDAARSYELIAAAGAAGRADFVSRGDNSGTNLEEKAIWALTQGVSLNAAGEPGTGSANASWYHKVGVGQAAAVQVANQCPFSSGACYDITDRGTFNRLLATGAVTRLQVVGQTNAATARGGQTLLVNSFHAYAVSPAKVPSVNAAGATAFLDFLTSPELQARLAAYPNAQNVAFFADARPALRLRRVPTRTLVASQAIRVSGQVASLLPGAAPLTGAAVDLQATVNGRTTVVAQTTSDATGAFAFALRATRSETLSVVVPSFQDLRPTAATLVPFTVTAAVGVRRPVALGHGQIAVRGTLVPYVDQVRPVLRIEGRRGRTGAFRVLALVRLHRGAREFQLRVRLPVGLWQLRAAYLDPSAVKAGRSRAVAVHVS